MNRYIHMGMKNCEPSICFRSNIGLSFFCSVIKILFILDSALLAPIPTSALSVDDLPHGVLFDIGGFREHVYS
jgi:hypothetical protein